MSVALATHDGQRWLPEFLDSLAAQTRPPDELVVCDDASADGTRAVLDRFAAVAPFVVRRVDHDRRQGPVRAFEQALAAVEGDLVALADQDDVWEHEKLRGLEDAMAAEAVSLAFCDAELVDEQGDPIGTRLWAELGFDGRQRRLLEEEGPGPILRHAVSAGCTMMVRRSAVTAALPFPSALDLVANPVLHDRWVSLIAACTGEVVALPEPLVRYRIHPGQATGARWVGRREQLGDQARRSSRDVAARAVARLRKVDALEARLAGGQRPVSPEVEAQLVALRRHLQVRAGLGPRRWRVGPVFGDVLRGGYHRFGEGSASAALDLLRR